MAAKKEDHQLIGFIKYQNEIGVYRIDHEAWVLDAELYCAQKRIEVPSLLARKDGRFVKNTLRPIRKSDIQELQRWFEANAALDPKVLRKTFDKMDYLQLDRDFELNLPVVLYDFDERTAFECPDLNPYTPFDDYLLEGWGYLVVEGFDALVPEEFVYWSPYSARLDCRDPKTL